VGLQRRAAIDFNDRRAGLHQRGNRPLRRLPQQRVGLSAVPNAVDMRPHVVALPDAVHRAEDDQLFGQPIRGSFC
jgi:hypothetical protein